MIQDSANRIKKIQLADIKKLQYFTSLTALLHRYKSKISP